jgi:hypothetical protein
MSTTAQQLAIMRYIEEHNGIEVTFWLHPKDAPHMRRQYPIDPTRYVLEMNENELNELNERNINRIHEY